MRHQMIAIAFTLSTELDLPGQQGHTSLERLGHTEVFQGSRSAFEP
jgi:hypothetical protein